MLRFVPMDLGVHTRSQELMTSSNFEFRAMLAERHPAVHPTAATVATPGRRPTSSEGRRISLSVLSGAVSPVAASGSAAAVHDPFGLGATEAAPSGGGGAGGGGGGSGGSTGSGGGGGGVQDYHHLAAHTPAASETGSVKNQLDSFHRANLGVLTQSSEKVAKSVVASLIPKLEVPCGGCARARAAPLGVDGGVSSFCFTQALGDRLSSLEMGAAASGRGGGGGGGGHDDGSDGSSLLRSVLMRGWRFNLLLTCLAANIALQVIVLGIVSEISAVQK
jgi:hypothetical protein